MSPVNSGTAHSPQCVGVALNDQSSPYQQQIGDPDPHTPPEGGTNYTDDKTVVAESPNQLGPSAFWLPLASVNSNNIDHNITCQKFSDDVRSRQRALEDLLQRGRRKAEAEYLRTSDASVFDQFLAPFVARREDSPRRDWVLDQTTQRWYLYDPATEEVLWCPTADSFA